MKKSKNNTLKHPSPIFSIQQVASKKLPNAIDPT